MIVRESLISEMASLRSYVNAPSDIKFPRILRELAYDCNLEIEIEMDKSLLRERNYFTVHGEKSDIKKFIKLLKNTIKEYES